MNFIPEDEAYWKQLFPEPKGSHLSAASLYAGMSLLDKASDTIMQTIVQHYHKDARASLMNFAQHLRGRGINFYEEIEKVFIKPLPMSEGDVLDLLCLANRKKYYMPSQASIFAMIDKKSVSQGGLKTRRSFNNYFDLLSRNAPDNISLEKTIKVLKEFNQWHGFDDETQTKIRKKLDETYTPEQLKKWEGEINTLTPILNENVEYDKQINLYTHIYAIDTLRLARNKKMDINNSGFSFNQCMNNFYSYLQKSYHDQAYFHFTPSSSSTFEKTFRIETDSQEVIKEVEKTEKAFLDYIVGMLANKESLNNLDIEKIGRSIVLHNELNDSLSVKNTVAKKIKV